MRTYDFAVVRVSSLKCTYFDLSLTFTYLTYLTLELTMDTHKEHVYALITKTIEQYNQENGTSFSSEVGELGEAYASTPPETYGGDQTQTSYLERADVLDRQITKVQDSIDHYTTIGNQAEVQYLTVELNQLRTQLDQLVLEHSLQTELDTHQELPDTHPKYRDPSFIQKDQCGKCQHPLCTNCYP